MKQITLRLPDELAEALRDEAARAGRSLNSFASLALGAAVDPDLEGDEVDRTRARLRRAGLLVEVESLAESPPEEATLARARAAASRGKPLSEHVRDGRGPR